MWCIHFDGHPLKYNGEMSKYANVINWKCAVRIFIIAWSTDLLNFPCLHIGILKQSYIKWCGNHIFPCRGRKCQLGQIPLCCLSPKKKIGFQIPNNAQDFTMLVSKCLYLLIYIIYKYTTPSAGQFFSTEIGFRCLQILMQCTSNLLWFFNVVDG